MKIKIKTSCSGDKFNYSPGQTVDADANVAKDLIAAGYAEEVKATKPKGGAAGAET